MSLSVIKNWLADPERSYQEGVKLYNAYKISPKHDNFFHAVTEPKKGSIHFKMLINQIERAAFRLVSNPDIKQKDIKIKPGKKISVQSIGSKSKASKGKSVKIDDNPKVRYEDLSEEMKKKYDEIKQIPKKQAEIHAKIKNPDLDDASRKKLTEELDALEALRSANWASIDEWWLMQKGKFINENQGPSREEIAEKVKYLDNIKRTYLPREKRALKKAKEAGDKQSIKKIEAKISKYEENKKDLESFLSKS